MKGKILINAYLDSREYLYEAERLSEEFEKLGVDVSVVRLDEYPAIISDGKTSIDFSADFFVYLDKDKYVLTMLETDLRRQNVNVYRAVGQRRAYAENAPRDFVLQPKRKNQGKSR